MDAEIQNKREVSKPDFGRIFKEIAEKNNLCDTKIEAISRRKEWNSLDVIKMNEKLFGNSSVKNIGFNQNRKAYDESSIIKILNYQKEYGLNNTEMTKIFKVSRNTIAKWQKLFEKY